MKVLPDRLVPRKVFAQPVLGETRGNNIYIKVSNCMAVCILQVLLSVSQETFFGIQSSQLKAFLHMLIRVQPFRFSHIGPSNTTACHWSLSNGSLRALRMQIESTPCGIHIHHLNLVRVVTYSATYRALVLTSSFEYKS